MKPFGRGIQIIQMENGEIELAFVEHSSYVFASPITHKRLFNNWTEVVNFLKMWETLSHVQFWDNQVIISSLTMG